MKTTSSSHRQPADLPHPASEGVGPGTARGARSEDIHPASLRPLSLVQLAPPIVHTLVSRFLLPLEASRFAHVLPDRRNAIYSAHPISLKATPPTLRAAHLLLMIHYRRRLIDHHQELQRRIAEINAELEAPLTPAAWGELEPSRTKLLCDERDRINSLIRPIIGHEATLHAYEQELGELGVVLSQASGSSDSKPPPINMDEPD